jgi:transcription initiation factor TFIID subunit 5
LHLDESYSTPKDAGRAKINVEFNRCLLVNGFRRLEALERKGEFDAGVRTAEASVSANPLEPSVLLTTLCSSSSSGSQLGRFGPADISSIWEESGVGITCAKLSPPDGRRIAAGCDDSAVRIWSVFDPRKKEGGTKQVEEASIVLLGHKNGFPVFDVCWNRDARSLLSAGGDGSVRLWDTMAVGPFGSVVKPKSRCVTPKQDDDEEKPEEPGMSIPGLKPEATETVSGAALAVYRGHAPGVPIWSVKFAPSGYYFATAAADATARIWVTDKPTPVRILSGHTTASVNTVEWHPNCNYVLTGCDDKTVRMWDVQTGRCVRLLNGGSHGINVVSVCPSGRFCSGADYAGTIHVWDLGTGKKINEYRSSESLKRDLSGSSTASMLHTLCYSPCGSALAAGGDDCVVRIWDVRGAANHMGNAEYAEQQGWGEAAPVAEAASVQQANRAGTKEPHKSFYTRRTMLLDLHYTKRNLLLSVGKYTTPVPLVAPITD